MKTTTKIKRKIGKSIKIVIGLKPRSEPRYAFSEATKQEVLRLQNYRCANYGCKSRDWKTFEFDHMRGRSNNSILNCQALCPYHHRKKTKLDGQRMRAHRRNTSKNNRL